MPKLTFTTHALDQLAKLTNDADLIRGIQTRLLEAAANPDAHLTRPPVRFPQTSLFLEFVVQDSNMDDWMLGALFRRISDDEIRVTQIEGRLGKTYRELG